MTPKGGVVSVAVRELLGARGPTPLWLVYQFVEQKFPDLSWSSLKRQLEWGSEFTFDLDDRMWRVASDDGGQARSSLFDDPAHPPRLEPWPWQAQALEAWRAHQRSGVIEAVTGTGKTRVGLLAIYERLLDGGKAQVLVPTVVLQRQWVKEIRAAFPGLAVGRQGGGHQDTLENKDVLVGVINSAAGHPATGLGKEDGLLVADECHRYGAEVFSRALSEDFDWRLGLSATYERNDDGLEERLRPYFGPVCFSYPYELAVPDEIVAPFSVVVVRVPLTGSERSEYEEWTDIATTARRTLVKHCGLPEQPFGEFMAAAGRLARMEDFGDACVRAATQYLKAFSERRRLLAECDAKYQALAQLAPAVEVANGTLVFTESIDGAEHASEALRDQGLEAWALHSRHDQPYRDWLLRDFGRRDIHALCAPRVLDEGVDVPEADLAVVLGATQTKRQMIQRMGRVLRRKSEGGMARFALLVVEGTPEDPTRGGHEGFLDAITDVAVQLRSVNGFSSAALDQLTQARVPPHLEALRLWARLADSEEIERLARLPETVPRSVSIHRDGYPDLCDALENLPDVAETDSGVRAPAWILHDAARLARLRQASDQWA